MALYPLIFIGTTQPIIKQDIFNTLNTILAWDNMIAKNTLVGLNNLLDIIIFYY